jgi:hypothetical protein
MGWAIADGRLEIIRGRQGRQGLRGMSLSTFLDLVWVEIYDDAPLMGDRQQYRQIMREMFIDGKDPYDIWYTDSKGKRKRLSSSPADSGAPVPKTALENAEAWREMAIKAREAREQQPK